MSGLKRDIPVPTAMPAAYKILLKRENANTCICHI